MNPTRPILKYHGGKFRIAKWVISHFPHHQVYVEPFCGAASVLMTKVPSTNEVLNDLSNRLINVFRILRNPKQAKLLMEQLRLTPCSEVEYLASREISEDPIEDARRTIVLSHQGHGGSSSGGRKKSGWRRGARFDRQKSSADEWSEIHNYVMAWCDRLRRVFIESKDASAVIRQWDRPETLFYVDPPYVSDTRSARNKKIYDHEMDDDAHVALAKVLDSVGGKVVLSGYPSELYDRLYGSWRRVERKAMAEKGKETIEVLWMNFEPENKELF